MVGSLDVLVGRQEIYTIGLTAKGGSHGLPWGKPTTQDSPQESALERECADDITLLSNQKRPEAIDARLFGYQYRRRRWNEIFDGVICDRFVTSRVVITKSQK